MLTGIRVQNPSRSDLPELNIPLSGHQELAVVFIDGLNPVPAVISSTPYASTSGEFYQSSRVGVRNIVLTLELNPSYQTGEDVEALRARLYGYFAPRNHVDFDFTTDRGPRLISGVVETFEAPLFVSRPQVQISILCPDPYFTSGNARVKQGYIASNSGLIVPNDGDVAIGFKAQVTRGAEYSDSTVFRLSVGPIDERRLRVVGSFPKYSYVDVDTRVGQKEITRNASDSLLPNVEIGSKWPILKPGPNAVGGGFENVTPADDAYLKIEFAERFVGL